MPEKDSKNWAGVVEVEARFFVEIHAIDNCISEERAREIAVDRIIRVVRDAARSSELTPDQRILLANNTGGFRAIGSNPARSL